MRILGFVLCFTFLCPQVSGAQERFFNFLDGWVNHYSIETQDQYLLMGLSLNGGATVHEFRYNYVDFQGNVVDSIEYSIDSVVSTSAWSTTTQLMDFLGNDTAYCAAYFGDPNANLLYGGVVRFIPTTREITLLHSNSDDGFSQFYCIKVKNDTSLLVAGFLSTSTGQNQRTSLYEMDTEGNIRWEQIFFGGGQTHTRPNQILTMNNGNIALMMREYDPVNPALFVAREQAIVVMMDSVGNELWRVSPGDTANYRIWPGGMVELPNGELLVSYTDPYYYDEDGEWHFNDSNTVHLSNYSASGTLLWEQDYLYQIINGLDFPRVHYRVRQMQSLSDGNILLTGTTGYGGLMLKIEPNGDMVWFREHLRHPWGENDVISEHTHIYHTLPTSDGGFLSTGQYRSDPGNIYPAGIQTAIALKVDEYGCLEEGCGPTDAVGELDAGQGLVVFPNPATDVVQVRSSKFKVKSLALRDVRGTILKYLEPSTLNLELSLKGLASGIYLIQAKLEDGSSVNAKIMKR